MNSPRPVAIALAALAACVLTPLAWAGPLDPPAGPIASTPGPEPRTAINATNTPGDADSVFKITQPGSYYLTGNVTGASGKSGIEIGSSNVTVDLMGFSLLGVAGSINGVVVTAASAENIAVHDGIASGWGNDGVAVAPAVNTRVWNVIARSNGARGIAAAISGTVESCNVSNNGATGIVVGTNSAVRTCDSHANTGAGISLSGSGVVANCAVISNAGGGITTGFGAAIMNCSARANTGFGVSCNLSSTLSNTAAFGNTSDGIVAASGCAISGCMAVQNGGAGIVVGTGATVVDSSSSGNTLDGIRALFSGVTVSRCTVTGNSGDGIELIAQSVALGNTCDVNGGATGANIHATGADNRIEGNNCTRGGFGVLVDGAGNIIVRNSCSGNTTNWSFVANNVFGPIINRTAPASAAVSGDAAASSIGTTDPAANITY